MDWTHWNTEYDISGSNKWSRLQETKFQIANALDALKNKENIVVINICCGQSRDILEVLSVYKSPANIQAFCLDINSELLEYGANYAENHEITNVSFINGDCSYMNTFSELPKADIIIFSGVFGQLVGDGDIPRSIASFRQMLNPDGYVVWSRRQIPESVQYIRSEFLAHGFQEIRHMAPEGFWYTITTSQMIGDPEQINLDTKIFTFEMPED